MQTRYVSMPYHHVLNMCRCVSFRICRVNRVRFRVSRVMLGSWLVLGATAGWIMIAFGALTLFCWLGGRKGIRHVKNMGDGEGG